jgi:phosphorylcholine metabolism protein LicD
MFAILFVLLFDFIFLVVEDFTACKIPHLVLTESDLKILKEMLQELTHYFDKTNVNYFLIGGSLLGSDRNGGLMPFDDDIDIGVCIKDNEKIKNYEHLDYYFEEVNFGYKFRKKDSPIFIDIMIYENIEGTYRIINGNWPNDYFSENDLFPLKQMFYSGIKLNVPNNHKGYLDRYYPGYENTIKLDCGHYSSECINKRHNIPQEFNVDYDNYKYLCYTELF